MEGSRFESLPHLGDPFVPLPELEQRDGHVDTDSDMVGINCERSAVLLQRTSNVAFLSQLSAPVVQLDRGHQVLIDLVLLPQQFSEALLDSIRFFLLSALAQSGHQRVQRGLIVRIQTDGVAKMVSTASGAWPVSSRREPRRTCATASSGASSTACRRAVTAPASSDNCLRASPNQRPCFSGIGLQLHGEFQISGCFCEIATFAERLRSQVVRVARIRPISEYLNGPIEQALCRVALTRLQQDSRQAHLRLRELRIQRNRSFELGAGGFRIAESIVCLAERIVRFRGLRTEPDRFAQIARWIRRARPLPSKRYPAAAAHQRCRVVLHRAAQQFDSLGALPFGDQCPGLVQLRTLRVRRGA